MIESVLGSVRGLIRRRCVNQSGLHVTTLWGTGWQDGHVHEFVFGDDNYGAKEPGLDFPNVMDEEKVVLRQALGTRKSFVYVYDFGDNWRHKVKVEKVLELDTPISHGVCIGGENACPPEDVGGAPGYEEFLEALADPDHSEHQHLKDWIGGSFNPAAFDVAEANQRLTPEVL